MLKHSTSVSVIIPFYNEMDWLFEAIESVYNQSFKNFEIILVNDGSLEDISLVSEKYPLVKIITIQNSGPGKARNEGIKEAKGKFIAFLDSDDLWNSNKLHLQLEFMDNNDYSWSHSNYERFWSDNSKSQMMFCGSMQGNIIPKMFLNCPIATPCVMIKRSILKNDPSLRFSEEKRVGEDSFFWHKLAERHPIGFIDKTLSKVRMRGTNAASQAYLQLKARADSWPFIKNIKIEERTVNSHKFIKAGYLLCKIGFNFVDFFNFNEKTREFISKVVYSGPHIYFKTVSKFYN